MAEWTRDQNIRAELMMRSVGSEIDLEWICCRDSGCMLIPDTLARKYHSQDQFRRLVRLRLLVLGLTYSDDSSKYFGRHRNHLSSLMVTLFEKRRSDLLVTH